MTTPNDEEERKKRAALFLLQQMRDASERDAKRDDDLRSSGEDDLKYPYTGPGLSSNDRWVVFWLWLLVMIGVFVASQIFLAYQ
ncbi:hypothetical protein LOC68_01310 [Blastopirellula sp. JC732]|uniref:Uncharacterized protein n=1 Tax=Blastopirellula sediminis TaxID=2894196 RepID=A0A9X1MIQ4_9BACT|nr:hypothetical protein [Blastopirellula sediminis]MCC9608175.1 hypothetical protein [Blastopirellula sediminis]MCC9627032.1 hypothetical protein [Blastopirellula sediminis]